MLTRGTTQMGLENAVLNERSQSQRPHIIGLHLRDMSGSGRPIGQEEDGGGNEERVLMGTGDKNVLNIRNLC